MILGAGHNGIIGATEETLGNTRVSAAWVESLYEIFMLEMAIWVAETLFRKGISDALLTQSRSMKI